MDGAGDLTCVSVCYAPLTDVLQRCRQDVGVVVMVTVCFVNYSDWLTGLLARRVSPDTLLRYRDFNDPPVVPSNLGPRAGQLITPLFTHSLAQIPAVLQCRCTWPVSRRYTLYIDTCQHAACVQAWKPW